MARITVEDCLKHVPNRFELVLLAAKRARQIALGSRPLVDDDQDKPAVLALREIAQGLVTHESLAALERKDKGEDLFFISPPANPPSKED